MVKLNMPVEAWLILHVRNQRMRIGEVCACMCECLFEQCGVQQPAEAKFVTHSVQISRRSISFTTAPSLLL